MLCLNHLIKSYISNSQKLLSAKCIICTGAIFFYLFLQNYSVFMLIVYHHFNGSSQEKIWRYPLQYFLDPIFFFCPALVLSVFYLSFLSSTIKNIAGHNFSWISTSVLKEPSFSLSTTCYISVT